MATQLFLSDTTAATAGVTNPPPAAEASPANPGSGATVIQGGGSTTVGTLSANNQGPFSSRTFTQNGTVNHQDVYFGKFVTALPLAAQTIPAQTWSWSLYAYESNAALNMFANFSVYVWRPSTQTIVATIYDAHSTALGTEWPTTQANVTGTFAGAAATVQLGDCLVVESWGHCVPSMAAAYTAQWNPGYNTCSVTSPATLTWDAPPPTISNAYSGDGVIVVKAAPNAAADLGYGGAHAWTIRRTEVATSTVVTLATGYYDNNGYASLSYEDRTAVNGTAYTYEVKYDPQGKWSSPSASRTPQAVAKAATYASATVGNNVTAAVVPCDSASGTGVADNATPVLAATGTYCKLTAGGSYQRWNSPTNGMLLSPVNWYRGFFRRTAAMTGFEVDTTQGVILSSLPGTGSDYPFLVAVRQDGKVDVQMFHTSGNSAARRITSATVPAIGDWFRVEAKITWRDSTKTPAQDAGQVIVRFFFGANANGSTPDEEYTNTLATSGPNNQYSLVHARDANGSFVNIIYTLATDSTGGFTFGVDCDEIAWAGASQTDWFGPVLEPGVSYGSLPPDAILSSSGLASGALSDIQDDPDATSDTTYLVGTSQTTTMVELSFPTPAGPPIGVQNIRFRAKPGAL